MLFSLTGYKLRKQRFLQTAIEEHLSKIANIEKVYIGWGYKKSGIRAINRGNFLLAEDGFVRSLGLGKTGADAFSYIFDDLGIYYDATKPSRLEKMIVANSSSKNIETDISRLISRFIEVGISKYNLSHVNYKISNNQQNVLIIDQTYGDLSLKYGCINPNACARKLIAYAQELSNRGFKVFYKPHPDVLAKKAKSVFNKRCLGQDIEIIDEQPNPIFLFKNFSQVLTITSNAGMEALLTGAKVSCFGTPYYAGYGLTDDHETENPALIRRANHEVSLETLFKCAYIDYPIYINPICGDVCQLKEVISLIGLQFEKWQRLNGTLAFTGISGWKKPIIKKFFQTPHNKISFAKNQPDNAKLIRWGNNNDINFSFSSGSQPSPKYTLEDGFLRSTGLGSWFTFPYSLVLDAKGIYYDSTKPSDLEELIQEELTKATIDPQTEQLLNQYITSSISKYNFLNSDIDLNINKNNNVHLIIGQVEDDESLRLGSSLYQSNIDFIKAVSTDINKQDDNAIIIYRPHPDVEFSTRLGKVSDDEALQYVNIINKDASIAQLINLSDHVHVMTSLVGFEALIHGVSLSCYGLPFYAGWGLTTDYVRCERRSKFCAQLQQNIPRKQKLLALVKATLVRYPIYFDQKSGLYCNANDVIKLLKNDQLNDVSKLKNNLGVYGKRLVNYLYSALHG